MKFGSGKRESREVAKPPPEAAGRVDGGGPWGPTPFDLPDREGNTQAVVTVVLVGVAVLLVIAGLWALVYFQLT